MTESPTDPASIIVSVKRYDFLVVGAGIIGLAIARQILITNPMATVLVLEKEQKIGLHASGRNSGVLHAGFYYSPDSLKAKFCRDGNVLLRKLAKDHDIRVRETGKVVVATTDSQVETLNELYSRGIQNGVQLDLISERKLVDYEPLARTIDQFLWSPTTSVADKNEIISALFHDAVKLGAEVVFDTEFVFEGNEFSLKSESIKYSYLINCAGSSSLRIAKTMGFGSKYQMLPFLGAYRAVPSPKLPLKTLVYPIPDPVNPFLGTHFTITADGYTKIGPTALPVFFAEQYSFFEGWNLYEGRQTLDAMMRFLRSNLATFTEMANRELKRIFLSGLIDSASQLVPSAAHISGWERRPAGIRAQLFDTTTKTLEHDFIVEGDSKSTHVLNAVSPGWTSSLAFAEWIVNHFIDSVM